MHMGIGSLILVLMILRFAVRMFTKKPPHADIGNATLNKLAIAAHYVFYLAVFAMCASGLATAFSAGLPDIVFGGSGAPLPENFNDIAPRAAHGVLAKVLVLLIIGHVLAFLFHQYVRKDNLFSRMWFGDRSL